MGIHLFTMSWFSMWTEKLRKAEIILQTEFPPECPVCRDRMRTGFIADVIIRWMDSSRKTDKAIYPFLEKNPYFRRLFRSWSVFPAYSCENCCLAIGKLDMKRRKFGKGHVTYSKTLAMCPYCGHQTKSGKLIGNRGIRWADGVGYMLYLKKMRFIEPLPIFRLGCLPALRCKECGIVFVRYKPQKNWVQFLKLIALLAIFVGGAAVIIFDGAYLLG